MIVSPDFLDHWKTRMLIDALGDNCAPIYVIRLWAHCQNRKTHILPSDNPEVTKAICQAPHDAKLFHSAMIAAGFIEVLDGKTVAHEWDSVNAYLINSWANGKKGGRPPKKTQTKPKQNPELTQSKPIREEKIRETSSDVHDDDDDLYSIIKSCNVFSHISHERFKLIMRPFWRLKNTEQSLRKACLKATSPDAVIHKAEGWLIKFLENEPEKSKEVRGL